MKDLFTHIWKAWKPAAWDNFVFWVTLALMILLGGVSVLMYLTGYSDWYWTAGFAGAFFVKHPIVVIKGINTWWNELPQKKPRIVARIRLGLRGWIGVAMIPAGFYLAATEHPAFIFMCLYLPWRLLVISHLYFQDPRRDNLFTNDDEKIIHNLDKLPLSNFTQSRFTGFMRIATWQYALAIAYFLFNIPFENVRFGLFGSMIYDSYTLPVVGITTLFFLFSILMRDDPFQNYWSGIRRNMERLRADHAEARALKTLQDMVNQVNQRTRNSGYFLDISGVTSSRQLAEMISRGYVQLHQNLKEAQGRENELRQYTNTEHQRAENALKLSNELRISAVMALRLLVDIMLELWDMDPEQIKGETLATLRRKIGLNVVLGCGPEIKLGEILYTEEMEDVFFPTARSVLAASASGNFAKIGFDPAFAISMLQALVLRVDARKAIAEDEACVQAEEPAL
ncbi:MAG: hypothetical protein ABIH21_01405 [Patescibacteria group bacterium]